MPKVELTEIRLGISGLSEQAQVGIPSSKPGVWKHKHFVHNDFIHAVITKWKGVKEVVTGPEGTFEISVRQINKP